MPIYSVALWKSWHPLDPLREEDLPIIADIEAEYPHEALFALMFTSQLKRVAHAAVQFPDKTIVRYENTTLPADEDAES